MKTILALLSCVLALGIVNSSLAYASDITITPPSLVDTSGHAITNFSVSQQIGVESKIVNNGKTEQKFTYLVQVLDSSGGTNYLEGFSASMLPNQSFTASQVWIPKDKGDYTIQVFVWDSLSSGIPLTNVLHTNITVN